MDAENRRSSNWPCRWLQWRCRREHDLDHHHDCHDCHHDHGRPLGNRQCPCHRRRPQRRRLDEARRPVPMQRDSGGHLHASLPRPLVAAAGAEMAVNDATEVDAEEELATIYLETAPHMQLASAAVDAMGVGERAEAQLEWWHERTEEARMQAESPPATLAVKRGARGGPKGSAWVDATPGPKSGVK